MGAIQSSLNSVTATVAGAVIAGQHGKQAKAKDKEQGLLAEEQFYESEGAIKKLGLESKEAKSTLDKAQKALGRTKEGSKANKKRMTEVEAAQVAFSELQDRIKAKEAMRERASLVMQRTGIKER